MNLPQIVSREEWLAARKQLLAQEKEATRARDALSARRRALPMVEIDKDYVFEGPAGPLSLQELFEGRRQLVVYHFMFHRDIAQGCPGCSHMADSFGHRAHLHARDTTLVLVSRAPLTEIEPFRKRMGWTIPWYSSFSSDFNYDFHVTLDPAKGSAEWNYRSAEDLVKDGKIPSLEGELPGLSVFLSDGNRVFHTYTTYARGLDALISTYNVLDLTPFGRGEGWGGMPDLDGSGMSWLKHHDKYEGRPATARLAEPEDCCKS